MNIAQIVILAAVQGLAELLPVSSSAHVIMAEKLMGMDPSSPEMTFLLVMLHTGTMFAVLFYFGSRWKTLLSGSDRRFIKSIAIATVCTGILGLGLKKIIEHLIATPGQPKAEIEHLFKNLPLMAASLFSAGVLIFYSGWKTERKSQASTELSPSNSVLIGLVQGLCLPFRGFSRSGATISTGLLRGIDRRLSEEFSFALAVVLTPPVIALELKRLLHAKAAGDAVDLMPVLMPGLLGMLFSFGAGLLALRWLSNWLEQGKWKYFGIYCWAASLCVIIAYKMGY